MSQTRVGQGQSKEFLLLGQSEWVTTELIDVTLAVSQWSYSKSEEQPIPPPVLALGGATGTDSAIDSSSYHSWSDINMETENIPVLLYSTWYIVLSIVISSSKQGVAVALVWLVAGSSIYLLSLVSWPTHSHWCYSGSILRNLMFLKHTL